jgi:hypothetical protein
MFDDIPRHTPVVDIDGSAGQQMPDVVGCGFPPSGAGH